MPYSTNLIAPLARRHVAELVRVRGLSYAAAARKVGVHPTTVGRWVRRAEVLGAREVQSTRSSRPHRPGARVDLERTMRIIQLRRASGHCAATLRVMLAREGVSVSTATIGRVLRQHGLTRPVPQRPVIPVARPPLRGQTPGAVVQMDTLRLRDDHDAVVVTVVDEASRFAWAQVRPCGGPAVMVAAFIRAQAELPFQVRCLKVDRGRDFAPPFSRDVARLGLRVGHSRPGRPNDNAIVERFNRTLRADCLNRWRRSAPGLSDSIAGFVEYYNNIRPHLGIGGATPKERLATLSAARAPRAALASGIPR